MTLAIVFPGQGSQSPGMQAELAESLPVVLETYQQASEVLGYDLWDLVQNGPAEKLNETVVTQPAMLAAGIAAWRSWQSMDGDSPAFMAGHSLGEYSALVASGALDFADAVTLVKRRAELMQEAVPAGAGAMAAILGLDDDQVRAACQAAADGEIVSPVNFNSPGQVVIAGHKAAVERATEVAKEAGARRALLLSVSVPSHCDLMRPAADSLSHVLAETTVQPGSIPVISNVDVLAYENADGIRDGLTRQLYSPVRWSETVQHLASQDVTTLVEAGPGKVLTGLARRIDRSLAAACIDTPQSLQSIIAA